MKKSLLVIGIALISLSAQAKCYRVNNNPGMGANFTSFQTAHDSCQTGDTLYVEGTTISYGSVTISKKISVIGPGFFLGQNPQTQVNPTSALFTQVSCNMGSAGTYLTGLDMQVLSLAIGVNNIVIKRNHIGCPTCQGISYPTYAVLFLTGNNANILIIQNYIIGNGNNPFAIFSGCSNVTIANNYIQTMGGNSVITMDPAASAIVSNNILVGAQNAWLTIYNSPVNNNIVIFLPVGSSSSTIGSGCSYHNNFSNTATFDTTGGNPNHNHDGVLPATLFVNSFSSDGMYKLISGSPAIGAGISGEDCGIFGGLDPYVLSGIPTVPSIYFFAAPTSGSGTLPVHVKIKSNK
ncbi:MAG TPA: hypothetical protein VF411_02505 [Bacteroidia bacterium]